MFGFFETIVEYYTGRDASLMTDDELALKLGHLERIREMESGQQMNNLFSILGNG